VVPNGFDYAYYTFPLIKELCINSALASSWPDKTFATPNLKFARLWCRNRETSIQTFDILLEITTLFLARLLQNCALLSGVIVPTQFYFACKSRLPGSLLHLYFKN
jgi:hypothetical protein